MTFVWYLQFVAHSGFALVSTLATIVTAAAVAYAARQRRNNQQPISVAEWMDHHSWWIFAGCSSLALIAVYTPAPKAADEIAETRTVYNGLAEECFFAGLRYAVRHSDERGQAIVLPQAGTDSFDVWKSAERLPALTYSAPEWSRLLPIFEADYQTLRDRLRSLIGAHQAVLSADFRRFVERTIQHMEDDRTNYYAVQTIVRMHPNENHDATFNSAVREPITTLGDFCRGLTKFSKSLPTK